jgi:hypothetical protein
MIIGISKTFSEKSEAYFMEGFVKAEEMAKKWDISIRQVQVLCKRGKIEGVSKFGASWAIPASAQKPTRTGKQKPGPRPKNGYGE